MKKLLRQQYPGIKFREGDGAIDRWGKYVCQLDFCPYPNKRVWKTIKLDSKSYREAAKIRLQWMAEYIHEHPYQDLTEKGHIPLGSLRDILLKMMRSGTLTHREDPCAQRTINKALNVFDRFFGEFILRRYPSVHRISDLPKGIFLDYRSYITLEKKLIWRNEIQALKTIISRFWRSDYCNDRVYKEIRTIPTPSFEMKKRDVLTLEERIKILAFVKSDRLTFYYVTYFLTKLGWRIGETLSIKKANIKWIQGEPSEIAIEKEFRKNRKEFVLETIDPKLAQVIKDCLENQKHKKSVFLFQNSKGNMIKDDVYRRYLAKVSKHVIGRVITPHEFRHSLVTLLKSQNCPDKDIMGITGHVDRDVLNNYYAHATKDGRSKVLEASGV
jgi:integrase